MSLQTTQQNGSHLITFDLVGEVVSILTFYAVGTPANNYRDYG